MNSIFDCVIRGLSLHIQKIFENLQPKNHRGSITLVKHITSNSAIYLAQHHVYLGTWTFSHHEERWGWELLATKSGKVMRTISRLSFINQ